MLRGGNDDRINIRQCEDVLQVLKSTWCTPIIFSIFLNGSVAVNVPQIADGRHLYVMACLVLGNYPSQLLPSVPWADVS